MAFQLHVNWGRPGVGDLKLQVVGVAALEVVLHWSVACVALHWSPLNTEATVAILCKVKISTLARSVWALVSDCMATSKCQLMQEATDLMSKFCSCQASR